MKFDQPMYQVGVEKVDGKFYSKCVCGGLELHGSPQCNNQTHQEYIKRALDKAERDVSVIQENRDYYLNQYYRLQRALVDIAEHTEGNGDAGRLIAKMARQALAKVDARRGAK